MAHGNLSNYEGTSGVFELVDGDDSYVKVYNNTGGALSNGAIKVLSYIADADGNIVAVPVAPATEATEANLVIVVNNWLLGKSTIANSAYGFCQFKGNVTASVDGDTVDVAAGDQLEILNGGTAFTSAGIAEGAVLENETVAIASAANTGAAADQTVYLIGKRSSIEAA